ncbi:hypothetical protein ABZW47_31630 [Streptomyces sp. NPDC004549]|uniref:hypothetical protein n=1 Tax=Streptomyces sp. NPDC004549 TaxID=3154283 RepID=UPI0033BCB935
MPAARTTAVTENTATKTDPTPRARRPRHRIIAGGAVAAVLTLTLAGCGDKFTEPFKDAPRSHKENGDPIRRQGRPEVRQVTRRSRRRVRSRDRSWIAEIVGDVIDAIADIWSR